MAHGLTRPRKLLQFDPTQPRKSFDEEGLEQLGDDQVARGTLVPLLVTPADPKTGISMIIDGERRVRAGDKKGIQEYPVVEITGPLSDKEKLGIQLATYFHKIGLSGYEQWDSVARMVASGGMSQQEVAKFLNISPGSVTRIMSPAKCTIRWQEGLKTGLVDSSKCYTASKLETAAEQDALLDFLLNAKKDGKNLSRDELERAAAKRKRNGQAQAVRMSRVKIAMPEGASVVISGKELSMAEVVDLLSETLKEARKAADTFDVKTFQSMMRDRARG